MNNAFHSVLSATLCVLAAAVARAVAPAAPSAPASVVPTQLVCDYRTDPLSVDSAAPRLGWTLKAHDPAGRGLVQSAYQIMVASSPLLLAKDEGDLYAGPIVKGAEQEALYAGKPQVTDQMAYWKVRVWDGAGVVSDWSVPAQWTAGVLAPADWHAKWITAPESLKGDDNSTFLLRCEFPVKPGLKRATLNICGLGQYDLTVNGGNVTSNVLNGQWTEYNKTCLYDTYDVTALVKEGKNAVGVLLGNGMYRVGKGRYTKFQKSFGPLKAIARIRLEYADGTTSFLGTDETWHGGVSPMTFSSVYGGEDWDARLEQKGWDRAGFDESKWLQVVVSAGPGGTLKGVSQAAPAIGAFEVHAPLSRKEIKPNVFIYDLGQEASHMTRLTAHGPAGSVVKITPSELLQSNGSIFTNNYNGKAWSNFTLAGTGKESYASKFYYSGHRYLQVECTPAVAGGAVPQIDSIEGVVVHSTVTPTGEFTCSNDLFNRIYTMIHWAEVSNMMSIISDCPHRERLGWLEQDHLHGPSFWYGYDMRPLVTKIIGDMADCQLEDGLVPTHVPEYPIMSAKWRDSIEWGSSSVLMPWHQCQFTDDIEVLRRNYPMMKRYVEHITSLAKNGIAPKGLGDWTGKAASPETPLDLVTTAIYFEDASALAKVAKLLGDATESAAQEKRAASIRTAFNITFYHADTHQYGTGSQGGNGMALALNLVEPTNRPAVLANLVADLERRKYALTVGEACLPYLLRALAQAGRSDVVYAMNNQTDNPGYGYQLKMGATALCETWDAGRDNSQIQFMLGHIMEWFYHDLAGIQLDPEAPGFTHFIIHPSVVGDLTEVKGSYQSVRGKIVSEWKRTDRQFTLHVVIPPNTTATAYLPASTRDSVTEGGKPVAGIAAVKYVRMDGVSALFEVGSGDYTFGSMLP